MKKYIFLAVFLSCLAITTYVAYEIFAPVRFEADKVEIHIHHGMKYREILDLLSDKGMNRDKNLLYIAGIVTGMDKKLKAGEYTLTAGLTPIDILKKFARGERIRYRTVTILPGKTIWDAAETLSKSSIMSEETFFRLAYDKSFLRSLNIDAPSIEGYLFPDTYKFRKGYEPEKVIKTMVKNLREHYPESIREIIKKAEIEENRILTLASIIEKEAMRDFERPIISAVYHNRLKKGMKLQADPTSIYGVKGYEMGVTRKDWENETPYNTYVISGLPPGPIAAPSLNSINASVNPSNVPYLYFVSKRDGTHHFSKTLREHINAARKYGKKKNKTKRIAVKKKSDLSKIFVTTQVFRLKTEG